MILTHRVSLEAFLAMEETKPYRELIDGEIVEKAMGNRQHSALVTELIGELRDFLRKHPIAHVDTELRHVEAEESRVYIPDVSVTLRARLAAISSPSPNIEVVHPDIAIEVLSPDDRPGRVAEKVSFYLRVAVALTWVVDPEDRAVIVYRPHQQPERLVSPAFLDAEPVLPGFSLPLVSLFAALDSRTGG